MTFSPRAIEAAARAAALADLDEETREIIDLDKHMLLVCAHYEEIAVAALSAALAVDGMALVPKEPTAEMFCAAVPFPAHLVHERDDPAYTKRMEAATLAERLHARQIWLAMLASASNGDKRQ